MSLLHTITSTIVKIISYCISYYISYYILYYISYYVHSHNSQNFNDKEIERARLYLSQSFLSMSVDISGKDLNILLSKNCNGMRVNGNGNGMRVDAKTNGGNYSGKEWLRTQKRMVHEVFDWAITVLKSFVLYFCS